MGKFDGMLLCTDLDDTLLTTDKKISDENRKAIEYFKSEGGLFTFATGRVPVGAKLMLKYVEPNAPMVCFNGAGIYDFKKEALLWSRSLDADAAAAVEYMDKMFDFIGIEVCTAEKIYFCKVNRVVEEHKILESLPENDLDYREIKEDWKKILFMVEADEIQRVREAVAASPFADKYTFVQSSPWYYELLPKGSSKGEGLLALADLMGVDRKNTIGIGDNENDLMLVKMAGRGVAVANAVDEIKEAADFVTADNNSHAVAAVIYALERGEMKLMP